MIGARQGAPPVGAARTAVLIPLALLPLLALLPPETRGESLTGAAALIALWLLVSWKALDAGAALRPLLLFLAAVFPLTAAALSPGAAVQPLSMIYLAGITAICAAALPGELRSGRALPLVLSITGAVVALHGVYQYFWGLEALARELAGSGTPAGDALLLRVRSGRAFAAFATPAAMGALLSLALPVTAALAIEGRGRARRLALGLAALQTAGLFATASATAMAALAAALLIAALFHPRFRRPVVLALPVLLVGLLLVVAIRGRQVVDFGDAGSPWRLRASNYTLAAAMAADHPWIGVGPGGFGESYPLYRRPGDNETQHVHNLPLEAMAETGIVVGLLVTVLFYLWFLGPLLKPRAGPGWQSGLAVGLAAFALQNLADFTAFFPSLLWIAALLRGWLAPARAASRRVRPAPGPLIATAGTLIAATLLGAAGLAANARLEARAAMAERDWSRAESAAARATAWAPWQVDAWMLRVHARISRTTPAEAFELRPAQDWMDRAIRLYPLRPSARHLRARLRLSLGDPSGAWADASEAARLYPLREEYSTARQDLRRRLPSRVGR